MYARPADFNDPIEDIRWSDNPLEALRGEVLGAGRRWSLEDWVRLGEVLYDLNDQVLTSYALDHARRLGGGRAEAIEGGIACAEASALDPCY